MRGLLAILLLAAASLAWAALSWRLHADGVAARAVLLPIDPGRYYAAQALFVGPLLALLSTVFAAVAHALARRAGGAGSFGATWAALSAVYAACVLLCLVLPDALIYLTAGRAAMARAMRFYAPLLPLAVTLASASRLRAIHGLGASSAAGCALAGLLVQLALGAPLLR